MSLRRLPLPGILNALRNAIGTLLDACADIGDRVADGLAGRSRGARDGVAHALCGSARHVSGCAAQAARCVSDGAGDELGGSRDAAVLVGGVVERHVDCFVL